VGAGTSSLRHRLLGDRRGASFVEHLLLVGLVALVALTGLRVFGSAVIAKVEEQARCVAALEECGVGTGTGTRGDTLAIPASVPPAIARAARFSPTVRRAIETMNQYGVTARIGGAGFGSYFNSSNNSIVLDANAVDVDGFVHEISHARYFHTGRSADISAMGRQEFIDAMISEEIEGTVLGAQAVYELRRAGRNEPRPPFFDAYERGVDETRRANPNASRAELQAAGREAMRQRLHDAFYSGGFVTSNTGVSYPTYYGTAWDQANPTRRP